jgi:hypothetical protein
MLYYINEIVLKYMGWANPRKVGLG